jgi:hypothetical protein
LGKNGPKSSHYEEKIPKSPYLDNRFNRQNTGGFFLKPNLAKSSCGDRRPTYLTNLKKRKLQSMVGSSGESDDDDEEELGASVR